MKNHTLGSMKLFSFLSSALPTLQVAGPSFPPQNVVDNQAESSPLPPQIEVDEVDLEAARGEATVSSPQPHGSPVTPHQVNGRSRTGYWAKNIVDFILTSIIGITFLSIQTTHKLPLALHFVTLTLLLSFASFFLSHFVDSKFSKTVQAFEWFGLFSGATALFISATISFPLPLKCITWFVYAITIAIIVYFNFFLATPTRSLQP